MRMLVAGGAGFIGVHLCERLLAQRHVVKCIDSLHSGSKANLEHLSRYNNFTFVEHDITKPLIETSKKWPKINVIYNLATVAGPQQYQRNRRHTLMTGVVGTANLLDLAEKNGSTFFQASTSEVYGDPLKHPQKETYFGNVNPTGARACYDEGKRAAETLCADYARDGNPHLVKIARFFNVYGPRMSLDGRIIATFITQALKNEPITVYGDGTQTRSFLFIDDLLDGIERLIQAQEFMGPVNLGNPKETTIGEIAEKIVELSDSKSEITFKPLPEDDPTKRKPDITLAKETLGWEPKTGIKDGLLRTIAFYREQMDS